MRGCLRGHWPLFLLLVVGSIVAAIVYELTSGGKPRAFIKYDPRLNFLDLRGDHPTQLWAENDFECLGWRATYSCDPHGQRDFTRDRNCQEPPTRTSGYCEIRNRTSGAIMRVMLATCNSWQWWLVPNMTCNDARAFTDYSVRASQYTHPPPAILEDTTPNKKDPMTNYKRGIAMIAYPKVIAGVYAIVRVLRFHGCALPVEIWIDPLEMRVSHSLLVELATNHNVILRTITDPAATKFHTKPYALYHSFFESVLFLDSDNIPARDPTYLFDSVEFERFGAIFWPDFWRPTPTTPFNVHEQSVLWQLLDMPFIDMFEGESGQLLVNKAKARKALEKLMFYSSQKPRLLNDWHLVYGDKDLFRLAWLNTSTPFYYIQHLVALAGVYDPEEPNVNDHFCGVAMVQRDPKGDIIFFHRNQAKLNGRKDQQVVMTHLQKFTGGNGMANSMKTELDKYRIYGKIELLGQKSCFYIHPKTLDGQNATPILIQSLMQTPYVQSEKQAIHFSILARNLLTQQEEMELEEIEKKEFAERKREANEAFAKRRKSKRTDQLKQLILVVVGVGGLCWFVKPLAIWRRYKRLRTARQAAAATAGNTKRSTRATSFSSLPSSSSSSSTVISIGLLASSVGKTNASVGAGEASWRRKKSFSHLGEDQHIL